MSRLKMTKELKMILMIGCCGALAIFSSTISKSPILPIFAKSLGATGAQIGLITSASTIPGILISYLAGDLADRFGYKKILIASLLIFATAPFLYLLVQDPLGLGMTRFYHGFATAAFGPVAMATIAAFSKKNTGQNLSLYSSATLIGRALAPTVGGTAYQFRGASTVYLIAGGAGVLALVTAIWFFSRSVKHEGIVENHQVLKSAEPSLPAPVTLPVQERVSFFTKLWGLLTYKPLLFVGILDACVYFSYGAFEMVFPLYAKGHSMSTSQIGLLLGVQLVGTILFKPVFGRASDKLGRLPMAITGLIACAAALFLLALIHTITAIISLMLLFGLGFALITASTSALAADVARIGQLGASLGILSTLMDVGQTFGPPTIGAISDRTSYNVGISVLGVIFTVAAIGCIIAMVKQQKGSAANRYSI